MDLVDLDKVLDEFEEEEKQALSIVPGQELRPSGYLEFLEKHQEQEWALINPNRFSSTSGYTLERRSAREPTNVAYDNPYDSFSTYKLGFMANNQQSSLSQNSCDILPEGKTRRSKSAIVTSLTRISTNGDDVNTVYTTAANFQERKGIANCSERKGTIAYQATEVQTDALSPASEQELLSSPFPKSDIIVDGHGETEVVSREPVSNEPTDRNEVGRNHNPVSAGIVTADETKTQKSTDFVINLMNQHLTQQNASGIPEGMETVCSSSSQFNLHPLPVNFWQKETVFSSSTRMNPILISSAQCNPQLVADNPQLVADNPHEVDIWVPPSDRTVGFYAPSDDLLDESVVNMYLRELDELRTQNVNTSELLLNSKSFTVDSQGIAVQMADMESESLVEEYNVSEPKIDQYFTPQLKSWPDGYNSRVTSASSDGESYCCDSDVVSDLGLYSQSEHVTQQSDNLRLWSNVSHVVPNDGVLLVDSVIGGFSYVKSSDRIISHNEHSDRTTSYNEPNDIIISYNEPIDRIISYNEPIDRIISYNEPSDRITSRVEPSDTYSSHIEPSDKSFVDPSDRQIVYNCLINGKLEIETILDNMGKIEPVAYNISDHVLEQEHKETEDSLDDDVILKQQIMLETYRPTAQSSESSDLLNSSHIQSNSACAPDMTGSKPIETFTSESDSSSVSPEHSSSYEIGGAVISLGAGARPKDPSTVKKIRPSSLLGLTKISLDLPAVTKPNVSLNPKDASILNQTVNTNVQFSTAAAQSQQDSYNLPPNAFVLDSQTKSEATLRLDSTGIEKSGSKSLVPDFSQHLSQIQTDSKMKRPTSLNLAVKPEVTVGYSNEEGLVPGGISAQSETAERREEETVETKPESDVADMPVPSHNPITHESLGLVAPFWTPDADAQSCMNCQIKFTMWKRRHHCRACGKVLCTGCCNQKAVLHYLENKEARVCVECHIQLSLVPSSATNLYCPSPNNPSEYCSKVPPNQQASIHANPPVVLVPTGVLKTSGNQKHFGEPKQVMFSDGIRPGSDLTELEGPEEKPPHQDLSRTAQKQQTLQTSKLKEDSLSRCHCLIPADGLPPLVALQKETGCAKTTEMVSWIDYLADYKCVEGPLITYTINRNLFVGVKIINMDCCMNRICWCYVTRGMDTSGQSELVVLLELTEEELVDPSLSPPREMFLHFQAIYEEALKGNIIQEMGHFVFHQSNVKNPDDGGFLFLQPTFQCLVKIPLLDCPYLFGILIKKQEVPWARIFPIRLMLRLGAECRYYPCPLISMANRKPMFYEIGHTIINLLADFHSYLYMLPQVRGATVYMENKKTVICFPRNRYNDVMKALRNSNEHVMALGSSFSSEVDSHLVCIQSEDGNYQTQAINIHNKARVVTGASFVVFNGALKPSSGLRAKSSIVEDGLMVQVLPEMLVSVKEAMKNMTDYVIQCGPVETDISDGTVELKWVDNTTDFNMGVKSYIDKAPLECAEMINVKCPSDYVGGHLAIRWTRVYFLEHQNLTSSDLSSVDMNQLINKIAHACCTALVKHLDELKKEDQVKLGLRVDLINESIGYEIGAKGQSLPVAMLNDLDTFLIPVIHQASDKGVILEFIFHIVE